jgi:hypothetical protein
MGRCDRAKGDWLMKRLLWATLFVLIPLAAHAQSGSLDQPLGTDVTSAPLEWTATGASTSAYLERIARSAGVSLVFEAQPDAESGASPQAINLAGKTARQALDILTSLDTRYSWQTVNAVAVIRPSTAWSDGGSALNQVAPPIAWDDVPTDDAVSRVALLLGSESRLSTQAPSRPDEPRVTVNLDNGTLLDVLCAIAASHGELMVVTRDLTRMVARLSPGPSPLSF